jgi:tetratricopeptide (TPR) repeat protein
LIKQAAIAILKISPAFLGDVAYNKTRLKKAEEFLRQCESQEGAYQQLTHYLYSQGDYDLAVQIGEEYLRSLPRNQTVAAAIGGDVGRSLEALGRYAEAAKVYEKMVADNPTDTNLSAVIQYHVVQLYRRLDETAAARTAAEKLLKEFPESREAALIRDEVAQGQGSPHP